jgi:radical SAM protein with 4Fe4S-binding SPASM domain
MELLMERVVMSPRIRTWSRDEWHIYYDPYNFVWIKVNQSGRLLLEMFRRYMTPAQVADHVAQRFGLPSEKAEEYIGNFVEGLVSMGFLHINEYRERERQAFPKPDFPLDVYLHLTNECNLKCPYCYNKGDREEKIKLERAEMLSPTMNTEEYKLLIARLIECGARRLLFTGGEPLMRPDILELAEFARSKSETVVLEMLTNAILINEQTAAWMCRLLNTVTISLDGHERHLHEHYRGRNTFGPTVKGIRQLVAKRKEMNQAKPYIAVVPALTKKNVSFMKEIYEFSLDELGADGLAPIIFQAGDHQEVSLTQIPALDVYVEALARTRDYLVERNARHSPTVTQPVEVGARNHCGVGQGEISVDPAGFVYPCQSLHFDEFKCGNVRTADIKRIYHDSPVMKKVRGTTIDTLAVCSHCDLRYLCNGGCRATAYNIYREFQAHNEIYCNYLEMASVGKLWGSSHVSLSPT